VKVENDILSDNLTKKRVSIINKDVTVFAFFLFLSFSFWYINSLGKIIESEVRVPIEYINLPKDKKIDDIPLHFNLFVKGTGYSILKIKLSGKKEPVLIDVSKVKYKRVAGSTSLSYYVITSGLTKSLSAQLRSGFEVVGIKPDTLFFTLVNSEEKKLPVKVDSKLERNTN
jgi:hypothetical protein